MQNNWTTVTLVVMFGHFCYYMVLFSVGHIFVKVKEKKKTLRSARARAILFYGKGDFRILAPFLFVNVFRVFGWILCPIIVYFTIQKISLMATTDPPFGLTWKDELRLKICRSAGGTETANGPHSPWFLPRHAQENKPLDHNIKYQTGAKSDPVSMATHTHHSGVWKSEAFLLGHLPSGSDTSVPLLPWHPTFFEPTPILFGCVFALDAASEMMRH